MEGGIRTIAVEDARVLESENVLSLLEVLEIMADLDTRKILCVQTEDS